MYSTSLVTKYSTNPFRLPLSGRYYTYPHCGEDITESNTPGPGHISMSPHLSNCMAMHMIGASAFCLETLWGPRVPSMYIGTTVCQLHLTWSKRGVFNNFSLCMRTCFAVPLPPLSPYILCRDAHRKSASRAERAGMPQPCIRHAQ